MGLDTELIELRERYYALQLPDVPRGLWNHILLEAKSVGSCRTLTGKVLLTIIMVDDDGGSWTDADIEECKRIQMDTAQQMLSDAMEFDAKLKLFVTHMRCRVTGKVSIHDYSDWVERIRIAAGFTGEGTISDQIKKTHDVDEAPVLFCVNYHNGRSFAVQQEKDDLFEYTVLYRGEWWGLRHEVYHLFGAKDFYYPPEIGAAAEKYLPNSVMIEPQNGKVDSLTAYLMGWTKRLSREAELFLRETAYITKEYLREKHRKMTFTGKGTLEYCNGTYTGDVVGGCPHGKGVYRWNNGDSYDGDWVCGLQHGCGVYIHSGGTVLKGRWENGTFLR